MNISALLLSVLFWVGTWGIVEAIITLTVGTSAKSRFFAYSMVVVLVILIASVHDIEI